MKCNICNSDIIPKVLFKNKSANKPDIVRCPACKLTFIHPQPNEKIISDYYYGMYASLATYDETIMQNANNSISHYKRNINAINSKSNSFLDLGCGLGYYSLAAQNTGYQVTSVEQDKISVEFAKNTLNLNNIIESSIDDFIYSVKSKFDVIFLRHVIEHVTNPQKLVNGIYEILNTNGVLIIETDNNNGVELLFRPHSYLFYQNIYKKQYKKVNFFTLLTKRPFAIDCPRHLFAFNMINLSQLLKNNNFSIKKKVHYHTGHSVYWSNLKLPEIQKLFKAIKEFKVKTILNILIEYITFPFRIVLKFMGMSAGICIYAQKKEEQ